MRRIGPISADERHSYAEEEIGSYLPCLALTSLHKISTVTKPRALRCVGAAAMERHSRRKFLQSAREEAASILPGGLRVRPREMTPWRCSNGITVMQQVDILPCMKPVPPKTPLRLGQNAFVLARPVFTSTQLEHSWQGSKPASHNLPSASLGHSASQGTFEFRAYQSGILKPSQRDIIADRTVTEFSDPSPSKSQRQLARLSYNEMESDWRRRVQEMNQMQDEASWRQFEKSLHYRPRHLDSRSLGQLSRLDSRLHTARSDWFAIHDEVHR